MKIVNFFNENGKLLQTILEEFIIENWFNNEI